MVKENNMYYRYEIVGDNIYKLCEKSIPPLQGENVVTCDEDIDLQLFDVTVGFIHQGIMTRHTKKLKDTEVVARRFTEIGQRQAESELDIDFRLSIIELGLA